MLRSHLRSLAIVAISLPVLALGLSAQATAQDKFKLGMAVGGEAGNDWQKAQGDIARELAKQRGWDYVELSNENDPAAAAKNAAIFIQEGVDAVIQFNSQAAVNDVNAQKYAAAGIPVITYDIAHPGYYFVGVDNLAAGLMGGEALGKVIKEKWNCQPDLIISSEFSAVGLVNTWRVGGMRDGIKKICPDIPADKWVSYEINFQPGGFQSAARDVLAAHPDAKRIVAIGISDNTIVPAIEAAEQLGRADEMIAWGQDGARISGPNVNPHLLGSVYYFLEGYPPYAFNILDQIAAGNPPPVKDTADDPAARVPPCLVTAAEAAAIPDMAGRIAALMAAPKGTTEYDLFCPSKS
jgi:ABC-type sugar transport system substrate-binding protein